MEYRRKVEYQAERKFRLSGREAEIYMTKKMSLFSSWKRNFKIYHISHSIFSKQPRYVNLTAVVILSREPECETWPDKFKKNKDLKTFRRIINCSLHYNKSKSWYFHSTAHNNTQVGPLWRKEQVLKLLLKCRLQASETVAKQDEILNPIPTTLSSTRVIKTAR